MSRRLISALLFTLCCANAHAEPALQSRKADRVPERGVELPFDIKTEPDTKLYQTPIDPPGLNNEIKQTRKPSFFGIGTTRAFNSPL